MTTLKHKKKKVKAIVAWALASKIDCFEYKQGDIVDIGMFRRSLGMYKPKVYKLVKVKITPIN